MNAERSVALVRRWVASYTRGLPVDVRRDRRDEIDDDLWSQLSDDAAGSGDGGSLGTEILLRLIVGIPADLSWSLEQRRVAAAARSSMRSPTMDTRLASLLGILGGAGLLLVFTIWAIYGDDGWAISGLGLVLMVGILTASLCLPLAVLVLLATFRDRLPRWVVGVATVGAILALLSTFGMYRAIIALPVASIAAIWPLGRIGVLPRWSWWTHVATASVFGAIVGIALVSPSTVSAAAPLLGLLLMYPASWIAIGWSLRHGATFRIGPSPTA